MAAAVGSSRCNPLSRDRLELLDLDELVKKVYEKRRENGLLEQQLSQLKHYIATVMATLPCSDASQLDELLQPLTPHPSMMKKQLLSTHHCESLKQWVYTDDRVTFHTLLGTEIVTVTVERFIINIHCYEDNYPHLPPKLLVIEKIPYTNMFKLKPKEILLHIDCDPELKNLMLSSFEQEMTKCFRQIQSQIFDTVDRDNIYQNLNTQELIRQTLTCNMSRSRISFMLPRLKQAFGKSLDDCVSGYGMRPHKSVDSGRNSITFILQNNFSVLLFVEPSKDSGWCVEVTCDDDVNLKNVPVHLHQAVTAFALEVSQSSVIDAVTKLLRQVEQLVQGRGIDDSYDSSNSTDDEFGALF